jgi:cell division protein FtsL
MPAQSTLISDASVFYVVLFIGLFFIIAVITVVTLVYLAYWFLEGRESKIREEVRLEIATLTSRMSEREKDNKELTVKVAELCEIVSSLRSTIEQLKTEANVKSIEHAGEKHTLISQVADLKSSLVRVEEELRNEKFKSMELQNSLNDLRRSVSSTSSRREDMMLFGLVQQKDRTRDLPVWKKWWTPRQAPRLSRAAGNSGE